LVKAHIELQYGVWLIWGAPHLFAKEKS